VGISRARERAIITYSLNRRSHAGWNTAIPSRFIREIPEDVAVHINPSGYNIQNNSGFSYKQSSNFLSDDCVATHSFIEDDRIFHQKFGYGTIVSIAGNKLLIDFDHSGQKSIMADFITKA
jgi:DNA helicase-2/ATP-dependent DNA helicase PcrA